MEASHSKVFFFQVRAFSIQSNGRAGPASRVMYGRTSGRSKASITKEPQKMETKLPKIVESDNKDSEATMYWIIGVSLGCLCVLLFSGCMGITLWWRRLVAAKFSTTNQDIHHKYQDTSLQINSGLQFGDTSNPNNYDMTSREGERINTSLDSQPVNETSFSVTDYSLDNGLDHYSNGSTVFVQVLESTNLVWGAPGLCSYYNGGHNDWCLGY